MCQPVRLEGKIYFRGNPEFQTLNQQYLHNIALCLRRLELELQTLGSRSVQPAHCALYNLQ